MRQNYKFVSFCEKTNSSMKKDKEFIYFYFSITFYLTEKLQLARSSVVKKLLYRHPSNYIFFSVIPIFQPKQKLKCHTGMELICSFQRWVSFVSFEAPRFLRDFQPHAVIRHPADHSLVFLFLMQEPVPCEIGNLGLTSKHRLILLVQHYQETCLHFLEFCSVDPREWLTETLLSLLRLKSWCWPGIPSHRRLHPHLGCLIVDVGRIQSLSF